MDQAHDRRPVCTSSVLPGRFCLPHQLAFGTPPHDRRRQSCPLRRISLPNPYLSPCPVQESTVCTIADLRPFARPFRRFFMLPCSIATSLTKVPRLVAGRPPPTGYPGDQRGNTDKYGWTPDYLRCVPAENVDQRQTQPLTPFPTRYRVPLLRAALRGCRFPSPRAASPPPASTPFPAPAGWSNLARA